MQARPSMDTSFETELEMRVARSRQTMDFAARQRARFAQLSNATLSPFEALALLDSVPRPSGDFPDTLSTVSHALLTAQWCRHEFPGADWAPLVGLMHDLGRLLSHPKCASAPAAMHAACAPAAAPPHSHWARCRWGSEPAWAVTSESYPLGCRFAETISGYFFLHACPDRRCSAYASPAGIYRAGCGLDSTHFTWTGPEYLSLVLAQNGARLPFAATFLLRYQNFESAISDGAYRLLMSDADSRCLPLLRKFAAVKRAAAAGAGPPHACSHAELVALCTAAMHKYFPQPRLRF